MTSDQKTVAVGAASGIIAMIVSLWLFYQLLPDPRATELAGRIGYALQWDALPALVFFVMVAAVGNARFKSEAIDPTLGRESKEMVIDGRVADNTLQQLVPFLVGSAALAAGVEGSAIKVVGAAAITFAMMRIAFWIGYRIKPVYRAFGFSSTAYMNLGLLVAALWMGFR